MLCHVIWAREALIKSLSAKTVLLVLASHADKENKAFPGIPLLARECSLTERGVMKAIQTLTQGDPPLLAVERQLGKHNLYRLMMGESATQEAPKQVETPEHSSPLNIVHPVTEFTPPMNVVHLSPEHSSRVPLNVVHPKGKGKDNEQQGKEIDAGASVLSLFPVELKSTKKPRKEKSGLCKLPDSFLLTPALMEWAKEKGHTHMQERYDYFVEAAKIREYQYANWDLAFQKSVRENWAKINTQPTLITQSKSGTYDGNRKLSASEIASKWAVPPKPIDQRPQAPAPENGFTRELIEHVEYRVE